MIFSPKLNSSQIQEFNFNAPDKSLSHRSVIFSFLTCGQSEIENFLPSADTLATLKIAQDLGATIQYKSNNHFLITPPSHFPSSALLQCLNSGTTMRLYAGLLSAKNGEFLFNGDESLCKRPMQRIKTPLEQMGASFSNSFAPFLLKGSAKLCGIDYLSPIASAQIKSAFILAALQAKTESSYQEEELSRDHTERFLSHLNAPLQIQQNKIQIKPLVKPLPSYKIKIPNDPSSAMFFVIATLISENKTIRLENILLNPTRIYALEILKQMGAKIVYEIKERGFEDVGEIIVSSSQLRGIKVDSNIAWLIDEIPALCIAFACARGVSKIMNAKELRVKESDRLRAIAQNLNQLGIKVTEFDDGLEIIGGEFQSAKIATFGDHRIAMSFALVGIRTKVEIMGMECIGISFPSFLEFLRNFVEIKE